MNKKGRWYIGDDWEYSFVNLFVVITRIKYSNLSVIDPRHPPVNKENIY